MKAIKKYKLYILGAILGAIAGYLYYYFIGCRSGNCAISSKPLNSTLYFSAMGAIFLGMFAKEKNADNKHDLSS